MEKYLVNTYSNYWVECDSAESAAQEVIKNVEEYFGITVRYEEVSDDEEEEDS